jgi:heme exporter protein B
MTGVERTDTNERRTTGSVPSFWRMGALVAAKDLRIERHSRVVTNQVLPFAGVTMVIFAFALDKQTVLEQVAPGLIWLATMFSLLVLVQRSFAIEADDGAIDIMRVAGIDARAIFVGKAAALAVQLLVLEVVLVVLAVVLYRQTVPLDGVVLLVTTLLLATCGLAAVGTLYGGLAAGVKGRETLLPLLVLPAVAPVLIGATRAVEAALGTVGAVVSDGWPWVGLLAVFAVAFGVGGSLAFGPLIDE